MPRGVKGSGKPKTTAQKSTKIVAEPIAETISEPTPAHKYPSVDERIVMADQQIERLTKLNAQREVLIAKTESALNERKAAYEKSTAALEKAEAKKARLIALKDKPVKEPAEKLSPEERKARRAASLEKARAAKKAEKEKYDAVVAAIQASGKTLDEFIAEMNAE